MWGSGEAELELAEVATATNTLVPYTYTRVWQEARPFAFTPAQLAAGFAARPYANRHAGISVMLNAGVDDTDVAERAGNSAEVIHRVYGHRTDG